jgi:hypothetical protein
VAETVELVDGLQDVGLGCHHQLDVPLDDTAKRIDRLDVVGVGTGDP